MANSPRAAVDVAGKRIPWYFISIVGFFLVPISVLLSKLKTLNYPSLLKSILVIILLGYGWSYLVTSNGWWTFNPRTMLGLELINHLPVEEMLFYPLGGLLSILIYVALRETGLPLKPVGRGYAWTLLALSAAGLTCIAISFARSGKIPWYLVSQMALYNTLCLTFWWTTKKRMSAIPAAVAVLGMTILGFLWNWLAFTQGWWAYHAVLGWMFPPQVPVDDWNFFIFAPLAAISLYSFFLPEE